MDLLVEGIFFNLIGILFYGVWAMGFSYATLTKPRVPLILKFFICKMP